MGADTIVTGSKLEAVANAIRERGGTSAPLTLDAMPAAVAAIPAGGFDGEGYQFTPSFISTTEPTEKTIDWTGFKFKWVATNAYGILGPEYNPNTRIEHVIIPDIDFSNVTNVRRMFYGTSALQTVVMPNNFNASNITTFESMFYNCSQLRSVEGMNTWEMDNTNSIDYMFYSTYFPDGLDLASATCEKCTSFNSMFGFCRTPAINLPSIITTQATSFNQFCVNANNLKALIWNQSETLQPMPQAITSPVLSSDVIVYVADSMVSTYQAATNWSTIASRIKGISELPATYKAMFGYE